MSKKKKSATKKLFTVAGIVILVIAVMAVIAKAMGWIGGGEAGKTVQTANARHKTITQQVSASGKIQPENNVIIRSDVSGEIIKLNVNEGDYVNEGDLLLRIRPDTYQASIDQQQALLLTQKANEKKAKSGMLEAKQTLQRQKKLYEKNLSSESEYSQAETDYKVKQAAYEAAQYQVQSVKAQLQQAKEELQKTIIRAPKNGTVSDLAVEKGERVLGNTRTSGTQIMSIADMYNMEVQVKVNENDIVNVAVGDTANIEADAYPDRTFKGVVTEIANSADVTGEGTTEQVTNYQVKVRITTPHNVDMKGAKIQRKKAVEITKHRFYPNFKPGMSATVDILTKKVPNAIAIPIQAVTVRRVPEGGSGRDGTTKDSVMTPADSTAADSMDTDSVDSGRPFAAKQDLQKVVFIVRNGKVHQQRVKTGISDKTDIHILSGVKAGDQIVTGNYRTLSKELKDGDAVTVNNNQFNHYTTQK